MFSLSIKLSTYFVILGMPMNTCIYNTMLYMHQVPWNWVSDNCQYFIDNIFPCRSHAFGSLNQKTVTWNARWPAVIYQFLRNNKLTTCLIRRHNKNCYTVMFLFSDRQVWANSVDPDQRSSLIRVYPVCNSLCIFWMHYSKEKPSCSTFRVITANFRVSEILGFLR